MATIKRNALGRGLDALITMDDIKTGGSSSINEIELSKIAPNPDQPRREFDEEALGELAASIRELGIIQPISLRQVGKDSYQIIAGERRYRAALLAGLTTVPAYIRTVEDETVVEMALIENIQREDLNSIEIALGFQKLIEQYSLTQEKLSDRVGKKRATIANYLRLLKLPAEVQMGLKNKKIDMGHARALIGIPPALQLKIYELILEHGYSVRKVEEMVKSMNDGLTDDVVKNPKKNAKQPAPAFDLLKKHLSEYFRTPVQVSCNDKGKGKISISFKSEDELERIIAILDKLKA
ncbi:MAG: ParB/RepB/Spo0J family partition protein [Bacteroidaceae bacterium]|nr:ParB/RepB/Spo0J family partition protein [Bacteroidaceae bacterium]